MQCGLIVVLAGSLSLLAPSPAEAWLFHATSRRAAQRILIKGIKPSYFRGKARFGKGFYSSRRRATALSEKGKASSVVRFKESKKLKANTWDLRHPSIERLRRLLAPKKVEFRGTVKRGMVGPKLGRQLGRQAGKKGKAIQYRSVRDGGTNVVIPKKTFQQNPKIISPLNQIK